MNNTTPIFLCAFTIFLTIYICTPKQCFLKTNDFSETNISWFSPSKKKLFQFLLFKIHETHLLTTRKTIHTLPYTISIKGFWFFFSKKWPPGLLLSKTAVSLTYFWKCSFLFLKIPISKSSTLCLCFGGLDDTLDWIFSLEPFEGKTLNYCPWPVL